MSALQRAIAATLESIHKGADASMAQLAQQQLERSSNSNGSAAAAAGSYAPPQLDPHVIGVFAQWTHLWTTLDDVVSLNPQLTFNDASTSITGLAEALQGWAGAQQHVRNLTTTSGAVEMIAAAVRALGAFTDLPVSAAQETVQTALRLLHVSEQELVPVSAELATPTVAVHYGAMYAVQEVQRAVAASVSPAIVDGLAPAALQAGTAMVERHLKAYWRTLLTQVVLPDYLGSKWTASSKFMGGRNTSHSVVFLHTLLLKQLRELRKEKLWDSWAPFVITHVVAEFTECFLEVKSSEARTHQLKADVMYFTRNIRSLRRVYQRKSFPVGAEPCSGPHQLPVDHMLLRAIGAVSLRTSSLSLMASWWGRGEGSGDVCDTGYDHPDAAPEFVALVWNAPALDIAAIFGKTTSAAAGAETAANMGQLYHAVSPVAHPSVALPTTHDAFYKIELPPMMHSVRVLSAGDLRRPSAEEICVDSCVAIDGSELSSSKTLWRFLVPGAPNSGGGNNHPLTSQSSGSMSQSVSSLDRVLRDVVGKRWEMWDSYPAVEDEDVPHLEALRARVGSA